MENTDKNIGVDIGYGFTKTFSSGGGKVFPTAVTGIVPAATFGEINTATANNEKFLTGYDALREGKGLLNTRTTGFIRSNAWLAVLGYALNHSNYEPEQKKGAIVLGIPPGQYSKSVASEIAESVKESIIYYNDHKFSFNENRILIIPQGAGIFFLYVVHNRGDYKKDIAIVDIGHYTVDMLLFSDGKYIEGATQSNPIGVSLILDDICRAFYKKYRFSISQRQAQKLLDTESITIFEESHTLDNLSVIVSSYAKQIAALIDGFFESLNEKPEIAICGGGGVVVLRGRIKLRHKLHIISDPVLANCMGYWYYSRELQ